MKSILLTLLQALHGCVTHTTSSFHQTPGFHPVTAPANDTPQFRMDEQTCLAEVNTYWGSVRQENAAVIQFRQCLINKGYRLLS